MPHRDNLKAPEHTGMEPLFDLDDLTFLTIFSARATITAGRTTLIRGKSGSGKSTLLRMLNGMTLPSSGRVRYRGQDLRERSPVLLRREVVMLPQQPVLFGGTVREELTIGRGYAELPPLSEERLREALAAVRLEVALEDSPTSFSGGEKQRLCLARVLLMEPPVLLLDEPTVGLDRETEEAVFACIRDQGAAGRSIIAATHSPFTSMLGETERFAFVDGTLQEETDE
jgi:putative ABC transport system ATP-binding protein